MSIPFSTYDFFGNLACGVILLLGYDTMCDQVNWVQGDLNVQASIVLLLIAYVLGQVVAGMSGWLIETQFTVRLLGRPTDVLFASRPINKKLRAFIFPGYFTPLPPELRDRILRKSSTHDISSAGEVLFHHVRTIAKGDPVTWGKLEAFLSRYGFSRNIALAIAISAIAILAFETSMPMVVRVRAAAPLAFLSVAMYYRYLKFYRQYAYEMFTSYPDIAKISK